ncbi:NUDIX domain-containing protein [Kitasatospora sp. NPDC056076]|uniref:NUDIX domain-containing protein n=1 Tax=Kitasatospora sp. NPDC056076 TaxID=3345703 RepID=UPI0035E1C6A2
MTRIESRPLGRRVEVSVLVRDPRGRVLLVQPAYRDDMLLPGGGVHPGESIADAAARVLVDSLQIHRPITAVRAIDCAGHNFDTGAVEVVTVVVDGGVMTTAEARALSLPVDTERLTAVDWAPVDQLHAYVLAFTEHRIRAAHTAARLLVQLPWPYLGADVEELVAA